MDRFKVAQIIALGATAFIVGGFAIDFAIGGNFSIIAECLVAAGLISTLVAYLFAGLGTALGMAAKVAKRCWLIVPFPWDLLAIVVGFFYAMVVLVVLPIIPIRSAYNKSRRY